LETDERMGVVVISNRGVSIRFWRVKSGGSKLEETEHLERKSVENLRLGIFRSLILIGLTWKVNRGFAIRILDGSDRVASANCWVMGSATAHRQECLCH
jgi:hypothetical protein